MTDAPAAVMSASGLGGDAAGSGATSASAGGAAGSGASAAGRGGGGGGGAAGGERRLRVVPRPPAIPSDPRSAGIPLSGLFVSQSAGASGSYHVVVEVGHCGFGYSHSGGWWLPKPSHKGVQFDYLFIYRRLPHSCRGGSFWPLPHCSHGGSPAPPPTHIHTSSHLQVSSSLELSLVDGRPRELLVATLDGLGVEYHSGSTAGGVAFVQLIAKLRNAQV